MIARIVILNLLLVILLVFGAVRFRQDWRAFDATHQPDLIQPAPETLPSLPASVVSTAAPEDWTDISSRNLFSFDRNDIAIAKPVSAPSTPAKPLGPKPMLFGTMSLGRNRVAMVGSATGNRRGSPAKVGETIEGWTIVEIADKSMVVEAGGVRETVLLNDPTANVPRDNTRTLAHTPAAPAAVQAGSAETSAGAPSTAASGAGPASTGAGGGQRVEEIKTPFGVVRRPVQDPPPLK